MKDFDHKKIEKKWQEKWQEEKTYSSEEKSDKPKSYVLDMFPYPSGEGLHVGHPKGYIATDVYARYKRMTGHNVLHPMGWDAFGLPAENFALKNKVHPRKAVEKNVARFKSQLSNIGLSYDWDREINTTDPEYYKWTQWIFLKLYEKGLAYESNEPINWCPSCQTGLANEDLEGGVCERCGSEVEKRPIRQWVLKITDYADRLLEDLKLLPEWPEHIKEMQKNWIGKSEGAEIEFEIKDKNEKIKVFTTRADTLFGATYLVISPEHELLEKLREDNEYGIENTEKISEYVGVAKKKSEIERTAEGKGKTGVEIRGVKAINPATGEEIPIWVADYVLGSYGTGAVMAVPAHDERDFEFAKKYELPIKSVIGVDKPDGRTARLLKIAQKLAKHGWENDKLVGFDSGFAIDLSIGHFTRSHDDIDVHVEEKDLDFWKDLFISEGFKIKESTGTQYPFFIAEKDGLHVDMCFNPEIKDSEDNITLEEKISLNPERLSVVDFAGHKFVVLNIEDSLDFKIHEINRLKSSRDKDQHDLALYGLGCYTKEGVLINSGEFSGMTSEEAREKITKKFGEKKTTYRLQDWVFSRQRYWGEPIPIIHCAKCGAVPVSEEELPVKLPDVEHYEPTGTGESPLANIDEWVNVACPKCGGEGKRETNTMPQWAGSCWYHLRFMDPHNDEELVSKEREEYWSPVDLYVGGAEHATRHLIYARFWHKFLFDVGVVSTKEPFSRLHSVGLIQAEDGRKMSKRYGNVINPDDIIEKMGADTLRVYEMFMGPFENAIAWSTDSMVGSRRFMERIYGVSQMIVDDLVPEIEAGLNKTIKKVGGDIESFKFNTAISQMMTFVNLVEKVGKIGKNQFESFLKIIAPYAPHLSEEIWHELGNEVSIHSTDWPEYDESKLISDVATIAVQINGKVRGEIEIERGLRQADVEEKVLSLPFVLKWKGEKEIQKIVYVPEKLINIVLV